MYNTSGNGLFKQPNKWEGACVAQEELEHLSGKATKAALNSQVSGRVEILA